MYVCSECGFEAEKPGKHCGKPMTEQGEELSEEEGLEETDEEASTDE